MTVWEIVANCMVTALFILAALAFIIAMSERATKAHKQQLLGEFFAVIAFCVWVWTS